MSLLDWIFLLALFLLVFSFFVVSVGVFLKKEWAVPFITSKQKTVDIMIQAANIQKDDVVFDLGCGDGRFVFSSAKAGAKKSVGIEISPLVYCYARIRKIFSKTKNTHIQFGNFFRDSEVKNADVLFAFLLPEIMEKVFLEIWPYLKSGTRILSSTFAPKNISPDRIIEKTKEHKKIFVFVKK